MSISIYYYIGSKRNTLTARVLQGRKILFDKSTKITVKSREDFDLNSKRFLKNTAANKELSKFEAEIFKKAEELTYLYKGAPIPPDTLAKYLSGKVSIGKQEVDSANLKLSNMAKMFRERSEAGQMFNKRTGRQISQDHVKNNINAARSIELYLEQGGIDFDFGMYNNTTATMLGKQVVKAKYAEFISDFKRYITGRDVSDTTICHRTDRLKYIITYFTNYADVDITGLLTELRFSKPTNLGVVVLSEAQIEFILQNYEKIRSECHGALERDALEYWYVALVLNPRRKDMNLWTRDNLFSVDGQTWIKYKPNKTKYSTGRVVESIVPTTVLKIFRNNIERYNKLMPPLCEQINTNLKNIARRYPIFHNEIQVYRKRKYQTIKMCDFIHIHMMRSTGMSHKLAAGWSESHVKEISGHTHNSESFKRYVNISPESKKRVAKDYYEMMGI